MKNYVSLKNNLEFKRAYDKKRTYSDMFMVIYISDNPLGYSRLGISVSKKVGNSIIRHRITRLIRESYRLNKERIKPGYDIVIVARKNLCGKGLFEVSESLMKLLSKHQLLL